MPPNKVGQTYENIIDLHVYYRFTVPFASVGLSVDPSPNESLEDQLVVDRHLVIPVAPTGCKVSGWSPISTVMPHQLMVRFHYPPLVIFAIASTSSKPSSDMLVAAT